MSKLYTCSICDSEFKNSHSLSSHRHKYHSKGSKIKTGRDFEQKTPYKIDGRFSKSNNSLSKYSRRLPKLFRIVGDILEDVKDLKEAVNDNGILCVSPVSSICHSPVIDRDIRWIH